MILRRLSAAACCLLIVGVAWARPASADEVRDGQWYLSSLGLTKAWSVSKGDGVKVAVVDSGVDGSIPDLRGAVVGGTDFSGTGSSDGQTPVGGNGAHGTQVASVLAGRGHGDGAGVIGAAPKASLLSASFLSGATDAHQGDLAKAIRWAVDQGAKVINISATGEVAGLEDAVSYAFAHDVVVVAGSGNANLTQREGLAPPASIPGVVAVTGVDQSLRSDPNATIGRGVVLAAPFSTTPADPTTGGAKVGLPVANPSNDPNGPYSSEAGTSFSAPIVAGIAALIRAKYPDLDANNVINRLIKTATPAGGSTPNDTYGYGIVNANKALTADVPTVTANPLVGGSSPVSSSAPSSPGSATTPVPATSGPAASSASPASPPPSTASGPVSESSGLGAGAWAAIVVIILIALALIIWLIVRSQRSSVPPGHGPSSS